MHRKLNENQEEDIAKKKNKIIIMKEIEQTRKIVGRAESANLQEEKGNKIKRWKRGTELIRKSNPRKWLGQGIEEVIDLRELENKAAYHLYIILDKRDVLNEGKINIRKKLEAMETIK